MVAGPKDQRPSRVYKASRRFAAEAKSLGLQIRKLRQGRGWTLEGAAERMNLDLKHLQKIEAGQLNVTLVTLARIAEGFEKPIGVLFSARRLLQNARR
jgi:transcriptional regulator with XRE-family HTH domain